MEESPNDSESSPAGPVPYTLTEAEEQVRIAAAAGEEAIFGFEDPETFASWGEERTVSAKFIQDLCYGTFDWPVHQRGVHIQGARITDRLDLRWCVLEKPLSLAKCHLQTVDLSDAVLSGLDLHGSHLLELAATGLRCTGPASLYRVSCERSIVLNRTVIDGDLHLSGTQVSGLELIAAEIGGTVSAGPILEREVIYRFLSSGRVTLFGATVAGGANFNGAKVGNLDLDRGQFKNSVWAGAVVVDDQVVRFETAGELGLYGANIRGSLELSGANIGKIDAALLDCSGAALLCRAFFKEIPETVPFEVADGANFIGARIAIGAELYGSSFGGSLVLELVELGRYHDYNPPEELEEGEHEFELGEGWPKGKLQLEGLKYHTISPPDAATRSQWLECCPKTPFNPSPYTQLSSVMREHGRDRDATSILILRETHRLKYADPNWAEWLWGRFLGVTIAYGYRPGRAILWLLFVLTAGISICVNRPDLFKPLGNNHPDFSAWLFPLDTIIPIVDLRMERFFVAQNTAGTVITTVLKALGWVLSTLCVLGFTGTVRKR